MLQLMIHVIINGSKLEKLSLNSYEFYSHEESTGKATVVDFGTHHFRVMLL